MKSIRLKTVYGILVFENNNFDHDNYLDPAGRYIHGETFALSSTLYKEGIINMKNIEYKTDSELIRSNWLSTNYITFGNRFESSSLTSDDRFPNSIGVVIINYGHFNEIYLRS